MQFGLYFPICCIVVVDSVHASELVLCEVEVARGRYVATGPSDNHTRDFRDLLAIHYHRNAIHFFSFHQ